VSLPVFLTHFDIIILSWFLPLGSEPLLEEISTEGRKIYILRLTCFEYFIGSDSFLDDVILVCLTPERLLRKLAFDFILPSFDSILVFRAICGTMVN